MINIVEIIKRKEGFVSLTPSSISKIKTAEQTLGVAFTAEYKRILESFGAVSYEGHEIVGICDIKRLNTVDVTLRERQNNPNISRSWYVIEELGIDGIIIWQAPTGEIIQSYPDGQTEQISTSLSQFIINS